MRRVPWGFMGFTSVIGVGHAIALAADAIAGCTAAVVAEHRFQDPLNPLGEVFFSDLVEVLFGGLATRGRACGGLHHGVVGSSSPILIGIFAFEGLHDGA